MNDVATPIIQHLHRVNAKRQLAEKMQLLDAIAKLQNWQCERLLATHADMAAKPSYELAMQFFIDELYGPKDFSQRDADLARVIPKLAKVLPEKAMRALDDALRLNALSFDLDMAMAQEIGSQPLNRETYAIAYRAVGQPEQRAEQIEIVSALGAQLADVVHIRGIGMLISLARRPAKMAGLLSLHEFLERGYDAFKGLGNVTDFIDPVMQRERDIMRALFADDFTQQDNPLPNV